MKVMTSSGTNTVIRQATPDPMSTLGLTFDGWSPVERMD